jgi:tryptophan-rich sensory protein
MRIKNIVKLILCILLSQSAGIIGAIFTAPGFSGWYQSLNKPSFNPPGWVFSPVWITLYTLMGISLYLVINKNVKFDDKVSGLIFFAVQLVLNASWPIVFFGMKSIFGGFIFIILLWGSILLTILNFYKISKTSSVLLIPYLLWVSFAAVLNYSIYKLNS